MQVECSLFGLLVYAAPMRGAELCESGFQSSPIAEQGYVVELKFLKTSGGTGKIKARGEMPPIRGKEFPAALARAKDYVISRDWWDDQSDIQWSVERTDGLIPQLAGPSLGAAFALGLARACVPQHGQGNPLAQMAAAVDTSCVVMTGAIEPVNGEMKIMNVGGIVPKLHELLQRGHAHRFHITILIIASEQLECIKAPQLAHFLAAGERPSLVNGKIAKPFWYWCDDGQRVLAVPTETLDEAIQSLFNLEAGIVLSM